MGEENKELEKRRKLQSEFDEGGLRPKIQKYRREKV